ncbi:MAG: GBS Bsp-like repeat-containing protein [Clostridiales Family XIII bacterium]|jgi:hypothetical protein|nr:GBS Bsp-like repeat-containing protein [Clostridiales Family XIII bacterium]
MFYREKRLNKPFITLLAVFLAVAMAAPGAFAYADEGAAAAETEADTAVTDSAITETLPETGITPFSISPLNQVPVQWMQTDPRWGSVPYTNSNTIYGTGCGPSTMAMVVASLRDPSVTPLVACNWSRNNGYMMDAYPCTQYSFFIDFGRLYGINVEYIGKNDARALAAVQAGDWVICHLGPGYWTDVQHFDLWYDVVGGTALLRDPFYTDAAHVMPSVGLLNSNAAAYFIVHMNIPTPPASAVQTINHNAFTGTFRVQLPGKAAYQMSGVQFEIWSEKDGKDDAITYTAQLSGDTFYKDIDVVNHLGDTGSYYIRTIVTNADGNYDIGTIKTAAYKGTITTSAMDLSADQRYATFTVETAGYPSGATLQVAVWSDTGGQDDLKWYSAQAVGNQLIVNADLAGHKDSGLYYAHAYLTVDGVSQFVRGFTFTRDAASATGLSVSRQADGTYKMTLTGVSAPSGVSRVRIPTWTVAGGQDDILWYEAVRTGADGTGETWEATLQPGSHKYATGAYISHVYITAGGGVENYVLSHSWQINAADQPKTEILGQLSANERTLSMTAANVGRTVSGATAVRFAVWSETGGQDDLVWYSGTKNGDYWTASASIATHKTAGLYYIHAYATRANGTSVFIGSKTVNVQGASATGLTAAARGADGSYRVVVAGVTAPSGLASVKVAAWRDANQSDLFWYTAVNEGGQWAVYVHPSLHKDHTGTFTLHAYVTAGNGITNFVGGRSLLVSSEGTPPLAGFSAQVSSLLTADQTAATLTAKYVESKGNATALSFAVWSADGGQNDLIWYPAVKSGMTWSASAAISRHRSPGLYYVHAYATIGGRSVFVGASNFTVSANTGSLSVSGPDTDGLYTATVTGVSAASGLSKVQVAIWSNNKGQDDLIWYTAAQDGAAYTVRFSPAAHKNDGGLYYLHLYISSANGLNNYSGAATKVVTPLTAAFSATATAADQRYFALRAEKLAQNVTSLQFAVWSAAGGQDDLVWYPAGRSGAAWTATASILRHKTAGLYYVHVYGVIDGRSTYLGSASFTVAGSTSTGTIMSSVTADGRTRLYLDGISVPSGVGEVRFAAWSTAGGQDDIYWYTAVKEGTGYAAYVQPGLHKFATTQMNAHVYVIDNKGASSCVKTGTFTMTRPAAPLIFANKALNEKTVQVGLGSSSLLGSISNVRFAVWSTVGGQDDLVWYTGIKVGEYYYATANIGGVHKTTGAYNVHVYAYVNGVNKFIGSTTFTISSVNPLGGLEIDPLPAVA